jgi:hypothetical protein
MEVWAEKNYRLGEVSTDKVVFADLWKFGVSYWLIVALCIVFYSAIFPFQTFAVKFFMEAHGTSREFGGFLSSMLTSVCHDRDAALWAVGGSQWANALC